jgi:c-di-GMP-binding flagellar brake protein YcgR
MEKKERPFKERRKYVRLKACVAVKYTVVGKPGTVTVSSKNISAGGLCLLVKEELAKDTPLQLEFKLPDLNNSIGALGRVVWQRRFESKGGKTQVYFETGIEFTGISDFDRFNINRYVINHSSEEQI